MEIFIESSANDSKKNDQNEVNNASPVNKTSQDLNNNSENVINNSTRPQASYLLESNTNGLQFHLKPDISTSIIYFLFEIIYYYY